jgi:hypothetical protein
MNMQEFADDDSSKPLNKNPESVHSNEFQFSVICSYTP